MVRKSTRGHGTNRLRKWICDIVFYNAVVYDHKLYSD